MCGGPFLLVFWQIRGLILARLAHSQQKLFIFLDDYTIVGFVALEHIILANSWYNTWLAHSQQKIFIIIVDFVALELIYSSHSDIVFDKADIDIFSLACLLKLRLRC